ncbi:MAG: hypothetical protein ABIA04_03005 [Pseudomonadota bacterium]
MIVKERSFELWLYFISCLTSYGSSGGEADDDLGTNPNLNLNPSPKLKDTSNITIPFITNSFFLSKINGL